MMSSALHSATAAAVMPVLDFGLPVIRLATPEDDGWIAELHDIAFGPGRFARTAFRVRERFDIDRSMSLVAEVDGVPCGSLWMTPISVGGINGYMLGPLATHPDFRRRGAGKALARAALQMVQERGEGRFTILIGDQDYYCPLGFTTTTPGAVIWPGPVDQNRVLLHSADPTLAIRLAGPIEAFRR